MTKRMLIDGAHPEQTRVVVMDGNKLLDFDTEIASQRTLKGNIYLAKVTRVEPSLQAAFVDYGGNRHGFLPFSEIHTDYYRIPVADREALQASIRERSNRNRDDDDDDEPDAGIDDDGPEDIDEDDQFESLEPEFVADLSDDGSDETEDDESADEGSDDDANGQSKSATLAAETNDPAVHLDLTAAAAEEPGAAADPAPVGAQEVPAETGVPVSAEASPEEPSPEGPASGGDMAAASIAPAAALAQAGEEATPAAADEAGGDVADDTSNDAGDDSEDAGGQRQGRRQSSRSRRTGRSSGRSSGRDESRGDSNGRTGGSRESGSRGSARSRRAYTIQEVIKRGQIMLIQVVKEERGTKGAAVTTFLSLAGRYCVLMPNTARGGGISRKITNVKDRKRLKDIVESLEIQESMAVIVRTAGIGRTKTEIKRDYDYLAKTWEQIRDETLRSRAPALIYEESDLIKRTLRDSYTREIEEVLVQGDAAYREAKDFMKTLMPSHSKRVQPYKEPSPPLFHKYNVDAQLHRLHSPNVQLPSGGYLVINMTEALVAIDINSGRSTRERHIEETAFKTNMEAAEEIARQLRLRDLAGLVVIDFIDMEDRRNNYAVERKLKDSLRGDRARVQIGRISQLGLLEMSRQRLRPSLLETSMDVCPVCAGLGRVASTSSSALHALSAIEDEGLRGRAGVIRVHVSGDVAFYILNEKRDELARIERDYSMRCLFEPDSTLIPPNLRIEVVQAQDAGAAIEASYEIVTEAEPEPVPEAAEEAEAPRRRGRRPAGELPLDEAEDDEGSRRGRRGRRSSRRRGRRDEDAAQTETPAEAKTEAPAEQTGDDSGDNAEDDRNSSRSNRRRRRRRRGRGDSRSSLPGVATFAKSATPLALHVALEPGVPAGAMTNGHAATEETGEAKPAEPEKQADTAGTATPVAVAPKPATPEPATPEPAAPEPAGPEAEAATRQGGGMEAVTSEAAVAESPAEETPVAEAASEEPATAAMQQAEPEEPAASAMETESVTAGAEESPPAPPEAEAEAASEAAEPVTGANGSADTVETQTAAAEPETGESAPAEEKPPRPRRRGWWQRLIE